MRQSGITRQGVVLTDLQSLLDFNILSLSLSLARSLALPSPPYATPWHRHALLFVHSISLFSLGVTLKRRCTNRPSVIYLIVNKLLSLSLSLCLALSLSFSLSLSALEYQ